MTNKRKHKLERIIHKEYSQFETMLIGKNNSMRIITQLFNLIKYKIEYLYITKRIDNEEKVFMKQCNIFYMHYYHKMVQHIY
jgi:hypothetical protein|nr:MAG TPA: hypothetical protein [Caudoviricetes sp.]